MAKIKRSRPDVPLFDVPLYQVVEHIVGDLRRPAYVREQDQDYPSWYTIAVDEATKEAWGRALAELIKAARAGYLKVRGRASISDDLKELRAGDFPTKADNPFATSVDLEVEYSGERILQFDDGLARIVGSGPNGGLRVLQTDLCADTLEEVEKLWPSAIRKSPSLTDDELDDVLRNIARERQGRVPSQNKCAELVQETYPQVTRDRVRGRFPHVFHGLKQGRGPRKKCAR
jgi:hypothetical protein